MSLWLKGSSLRKEFMDFLNSQHLTSQDSFIHPFRNAGTFDYSARTSDYGDVQGGTIMVQAAKAAIGKGNQHNVVFHWDPAIRAFVPREQDRKLTIKQNDFVIFHFDQAQPGQPPCFILGQSGEKVEFDSRRLGTHDAFTHFFLSAGEYAYRIGRDVHRVSVASHQEFSAEEHEQRAREGVVVMIAGEQPRTKHVKVVAGQTVVWAVEKGENLSIQSVAYEDAKKAGTRGQA